MLIARHIGLRGRLILLLLAAFAVILAMIVQHTVEHRADEITDASAHLLDNAKLFAARQQHIAARADAMLNGLMTQPELRPDAATKACEKHLSARLKQEAEFIQIGKVLPSGEVACAAAPPPGRVSFADRNWFRQALQSEKMVVGDVVTGRILGKPLVTLAKAMRDDSGRVTSVLYLSLDLAWLQRELAKAGLPEESRLVVVDGKGMVVARHPDHDNWTGKSAAQAPLFQTIAARGSEGTTEGVGLEGIPRLFAFTPLLDTVSGPMYLWLSTPIVAVTAPAQREFVSYLSITATVLLLVLALVYWGSEKLLVGPLLSLSRSAARFGAGDLGARSGLPHGDDEIGRLARTLDETATAIETKENKLARANRALRVLSAGNRALLRCTTEQELTEEMCRAIVEAGGYLFAWVGYAEHDRDKGVRPVASWNAAEGFFDGLRIAWDETESGQGPVGTALRQGIPIASNNVLTDPDYAPWRERAQRFGYAATLALPLRADGAVIGALNIYAAEPDAFDDEGIELLSEGADDLAFGIASRRAAAAHDRTRETLKGTEAQLAEAQRLAKIGHWEWDTQTGLHTWSEEIYRIYGRDPKLPPADIQEVPKYFTPESWARLSAEVEMGLAKGIPYECDAEVVRPDGTHRWIIARGEAMREANGAVIGLRGTVQDITERKLGELALARANRALRTLSAGNELLVRATDENELLQAVTHSIVENGGYRMAWVGYADDNPEKTITPKAWAGIEEGYLTQLHLTWADTERGHGPLCRAIRSGAPQASHDIHADPGFALWRELATERGYAANFAIPLRVDGKLIGALSIYAAETDAFDEEEIKLLTELADDLAFGIETLRTRAERDHIAWQHEHHAEILQKSLEDALHAIAYTVEMRDPYTAGHERRVGTLAVAIAQEMGLAEEKIHGIHLAASVHDLGKIQIPAEILAKPGRLSDIEFMLIKTHPQAGYDILKDVEFPWPIADIVRQHHERLDGTGYPHGLSDGSILLESRIMAVADVVEAMASHRPYRAALGIEVALKEIERGTGSAYDPTVADACLKLFHEGRFSFQL
ncbi:MAG: GAF domain-containing protein [Sulfuricella sp.]|nr:GAF domain-containing protein [Sulfuricella sp.]